MNLRDRVAVVTGAAGGIGRGIALALARRGCHLGLADIDAAGLAETAAEVEALGVRTSRHVVDVADRAAVAALPAALRAAHGRVDLLVNNAGVAVGGTFEQVSEADFDWLMAINFGAVVRLEVAREASPRRLWLTWRSLQELSTLLCQCLPSPAQRRVSSKDSSRPRRPGARSSRTSSGLHHLLCSTSG